MSGGSRRASASAVCGQAAGAWRSADVGEAVGVPSSVGVPPSVGVPSSVEVLPPVAVSASADAAGLGTAYDDYAQEYTRLLLERRSVHLRDTVALVRTLLSAGAAGEADGPGPLNRLVDLACGPGLVSAELATDGWNVTGVDASRKLVEIARTRLPRVLHVDATTTGLPPGADAVVSTYTHTDVASWPALVAEAWRLLRPGGLLVYVGAHPAFVGPHIRRSAGSRWTARIAAGYYHDPTPRHRAPGLTPGGVREHVGVRHLTVPSLLEPVLAGGWHGVQLAEDHADPPTLLGFRAVRVDR